MKAIVPSLQSKAQAAFSLLEILVATAILVVIVLMLSSIFRQAAIAWESGTQRADGTMQARALIGAIARELRTSGKGWTPGDMDKLTGIREKRNNNDLNDGKYVLGSTPGAWGKSLGSLIENAMDASNDASYDLDAGLRLVSGSANASGDYAAVCIWVALERSTAAVAEISGLSTAGYSDKEFDDEGNSNWIRVK